MPELIPSEIGGFTEDKIKELMSLQYIESEGFDFKRDFSRDFERHICAMANTSGGVIVLGIDEDKDNQRKPFVVYGLKDIRLTEQKTKEYMIRIDPPIKYEVKSDVRVEEKEIFIIKIHESKNKPHILRDSGQIFVRIGSHSHPASREIILKLFSDAVRIKKNLTLLKAVLRNIEGFATNNFSLYQRATYDNVINTNAYPVEIDTQLVNFILMNIGEHLIESQRLDDVGNLFKDVNVMNEKVKNVKMRLSAGIKAGLYTHSNYLTFR